MSKAANKIEIFIMGKQYLVPGELTILEAMEYSGYQLKRGCGCRAGFCGACATVYRIAGSYQLQVGLACQTKVEPGMYLAQIPFFPGRKAVFDLEKVKPTLAEFSLLYPEIFRCLGCSSCTKVCPQDIDVMQYIAHLQRGEWQQAADLSFDCVMCGLCTSRCPVHIVQYNAGLAARRIYGRHVAPPDPVLAERVKEIAAGTYDASIEELVNASPEQLADLYNQRDIE